MNLIPNWVDLLILILLIRTGYIGFEFGTAYAILQLLSTVSATALTINYAPALWQNIRSWVPLGGAKGQFCFFWLLFGALIMFVTLFLRRIAPLMKWERLNIWLQGVGTVVGLLRGVWWSFIIVVALSVSGISYLEESAKELSVISPRILPIAREVVLLIADSHPGALGRGSQLLPSIDSGSDKKAKIN